MVTWKRVKKSVIALAGVVFAVIFVRCCLEHPSPPAQAPVGARPITVDKDCVTALAGIAGDQLRPNMLTVRLIDRMAQPDERHLIKLFTPACRSLYGAFQVAVASGKDTSWFNGFPFVLVDTLGGATDQALFERGMPWSEFPRQVKVATGIFSTYSSDQLIWTLGHELGHGVYGHAMLKKFNFNLIVITILIGVLWLFFADGWRWETAGAVVAAIGFAGYFAGSALISMCHEFSADKFGIEAAAHSGMGTTGAESAALTMLQRHINDPEDPWFKCLIPNQNVHPAVQVRMDRIRELHSTK